MKVSSIKWLAGFNGTSEIHLMFGIFASIVTYLVGGFNPALEVLLVFMIFDFFTGMLASIKEGKLKSKVGFIGIGRKVFILCIVAVGHFLDKLLETNDFIRDTVIYFYIANEVLSIIENAGRYGFKLPPIITQAVEILKEKGEGTVLSHKKKPPEQEEPKDETI